MKTTASKAAPKTPTAPKREKVPMRDRVAMQLGRFALRIEKLAARFDGADAAPSIGANLDSAGAALRSAATEMRAEPETFRFGRGGGGRRLEVGDMVQIRDRRRAAYEGLLEPEEMEGLTVLKVLGGRIKAATSSGTALLIQKGHVHKAR